MGRDEDVSAVLAGQARYAVLEGDCREHLLAMPENSIDAVVTDPPYGLSKEPNIVEVLTHWLNGDDYIHNSAGFMGAEWDSFVPGPECWRMVYRVMKPGAHLVAFGSTRTYDLLVIALRLAGFEVRDMIEWLYAQGMPKNLNVAIQCEQQLCDYDKRKKVWRYRDDGEVMRREPPFKSEDANRFAGWNTALKPAHEPIVLARKPPSEDTIREQMLATGTGALHTEVCKVGSEVTRTTVKDLSEVHGNQLGRPGAQYPVQGYKANTPGRWPPDLMFSHAEGCKRVGTRKRRNKSGSVAPDDAPSAPSKHTYDLRKRARFQAHGDAEGFETVDEWECVPGCPVGELDRQSGQSRSSDRPRHATTMGYHGNVQDFTTGGYSDAGGASRFFPTFIAPFLYSPKASRAEREMGCEDLPKEAAGRYDDDGYRESGERRADHTAAAPVANVHPTVKPIAVVQWLTSLVCPPGGVVIDPFLGSGSHGCAALMIEGLGARFIGMELEARFAQIARHRLAAAVAVGVPSEPAKPKRAKGRASARTRAKPPEKESTELTITVRAGARAKAPPPYEPVATIWAAS